MLNLRQNKKSNNLINGYHALIKISAPLSPSLYKKVERNAIYKRNNLKY